MSDVLILNPVSTDLWDELVEDALRKVADPRTEVKVKHLERGPKSIECYYDDVMAAPYVVEEVVRAEREGVDGVIINCFDDPGLRASRERVSIPVLGIGETSMIAALHLGHKFAVISTGRNARPVCELKALELGIIDRLAYASGIPIGVLDLRDREEEVKKLLLRESGVAIDKFGAEVIVLGCGGFLGLADQLSEELGVPVVDPTLITFKLTEAFLALGLRHSKVSLYGFPQNR